MSAHPRWRSACSISIALAFFFLTLGKARGEDQERENEHPFLSEEELQKIFDEIRHQAWKPFLSEEDLKRLVDDEVRIIKQELNKKGDRGKIQRAALLIAVAAQNWKDGKNSLQVTAFALELSMEARGSPLKRLEQMTDRLANFKLGPGDWKKINLAGVRRWANAWPREKIPTMMKVFSDFDPRRERAERELLGLESRPRPLKPQEMPQKIQLLAYKSALIAQVTKNFAKASSDNNYQKCADDMDEASLELVSATRAGKEREANKALDKLTRSCISCHETFLGRPNVQGLIATLKSKESEDRQKAADRLGDYGFAAEAPQYQRVRPREDGSVDYFRSRLKPAILPLIETLKDKDQRVRRSAVNALEKIGLKPETPLPTLNKALLGADEFVRFWFAYASRDQEDKPENAVRVLIGALEDRDNDIRSAAADALGRLGGDAKHVLSALQEALDDKDPDVRESAIKALRLRGGESAMPVFLKALQDTDPLVRANAATALTRIGMPAVPELTKMLKDPNRDARAAAAYALGRIGPKAEMAVADLKQMLKEEDEYLRKSASEALGKITPKPQP